MPPPPPPLPPSVHLTRLRDGHAEAVLAFERENRGYFARSVPDRGDDYFTRFASRHAALLAEQETGLCHFHVLLDDHGAVLGRVNLVDVADGSADLGYRIAERATGRGLAAAAVREIRARAATDYGLTALTAATTLDNPASRAVLTRNGFVPAGDIELDGRPGTRFRLRIGQWISSSHA
ncbi:GNAT family N-acetyltransferase [Streptomyces flavidovirens]|uniref:GNAT family N-acetyltransferase n=1 Tax=Streptomyces flavidovirens TaxID=67298 RepID=UPI000684CB86|nr:GNAT family N-acetyltransferase [Streptomyces flavidovirens]